MERFSFAALFPGLGSTFTLYLPQLYVGATTAIPAQPGEACACCRSLSVVSTSKERQIERVPDDREGLQPGENTLLIVEDDSHYARILCDLARGLPALKLLGRIQGQFRGALPGAGELQPIAISLDVFLPDMLGWTVLNHLKQDPSTRHIPVQILTLDEDRKHGLSRGAFFSFLTQANQS